MGKYAKSWESWESMLKVEKVLHILHFGVKFAVQSCSQKILV